MIAASKGHTSVVEVLLRDKRVDTRPPEDEPGRMVYHAAATAVGLPTVAAATPLPVDSDEEL